jgi:hypothetical protein
MKLTMSETEKILQAIDGMPEGMILVIVRR